MKMPENHTFNRMIRHSVLTPEKERELVIAAKNGDSRAEKELIRNNVKLVAKIADKYVKFFHQGEDLISEGLVGLSIGVKKFDPSQGVRLSTYSVWWIRAYILKYLTSNFSLVKIGTTSAQRKLFFRLRKETDELLAKGIDPTPELLAQKFDVTPRDVSEMQQRMSGRDASLNVAPSSAPGSANAETIQDRLTDTDPDPESMVGEFKTSTMVRTALTKFGKKLKGREADIFRDRIASDEPLTLQDLGERWGVSRERIRQIEKALVIRLRETLCKNLGEETIKNALER